jgi:hypothetical protein
MTARAAFRPAVAFAAAFATIASLTGAGGALAYHTRFQTDNCNTNAPQFTSYFTRDGSTTVALYARHEGYQWGGGCWNDNDVDDSPGDPTGDPSTGGEGGDCSGFTFKVWRESLTESDAAAWQWNKLRNVHGPYTAARFKSGDGAPNVTYGKGGLIRMDALASSSHIGLVYVPNADGTDQIIEAKGEAYGTNVWTRTYRGDSSYGGVRRLGWSA